MAKRTVSPLLVAAYPTLFLFAHNRGQLVWADLVTPLVWSVGAGLSLWALAFGWTRDGRRAAVATSVLLALLFAFGPGWSHIEPTLYPRAGESSEAAIRVWVAVSWTLLALVATWWIARSLRRREHATDVAARALDAAAILLIAMPIFSLVAQATRTPAPENGAPAASTQPSWQQDASSRSARPDIYYIVLDGYGSSEQLSRIYRYDNGPFVARLEALGFRVARESRANYSRTIHSLASALNLDYLSPESRAYATTDADPRPFVSAIRNARVLEMLRVRGYEIWSIASGYAATELPAADHTLAPPGALSELEQAVVGLTPLPVLLDALAGPSQYTLHRRRILYALDELPAIAAERGPPKLVFAHIVAPHPPFVFDAEGGPVEPPLAFLYFDGDDWLRRQSLSRYIEAYREQVGYVTSRIEKTIEGILAASQSPPIILLQGDHGPGSGYVQESLRDTNIYERMFILNAYYLPGDDRATPIHDGISPVNSFRVVLSRYFGENLELLPDRSFYVPQSNLYEFSDVTERLDDWLERQRK